MWFFAKYYLVHLAEDVMDKNGNIDPYKLDTVARLGGNLYSRVSPSSIFELQKPISAIGVGVDNIPDRLLKLGHFLGNELARLASIEGCT